MRVVQILYPSKIIHTIDVVASMLSEKQRDPAFDVLRERVLTNRRRFDIDLVM